MEAPTRPRTRRRANPDATLGIVVRLLTAEAERLLALQSQQAACAECGLPAGLSEKERAWATQAMRDLTKLTLGARKQIIDRALRNISQGGLDALDEVSARATGMPE